VGSGRGATPFIAFKDSSTARVGGLFAKMFQDDRFRLEAFLRHHMRTDVESTFGVIRGK
jgi:hypothetical protein